MRKLGIMGGTFDPIHFGHLAAAEASRQNFALEKVIFVPAGVPPHKSGLITPVLDRLNMVRLAVEDNPYFEISDFEAIRPGKSYTVDTMEHFKLTFGNEVQLFFITGADAILEILTWHKVSRLIEVCEFIGVTRPGFAVGGLERDIKNLPEDIYRKVKALEVPGLNISSTEIRNRVKLGLSIMDLVPNAVQDYIFAKKLYI